MPRNAVMAAAVSRFIERHGRYMSVKKVLAIDLGASSGRGIIGAFDGEKLSLSEIHRFSNDPVMINGGFHWDTVRLFYEIKQAILKTKLDGGADSLGIDTWGVDYGYIDKNGELLATPYHYRDLRTSDIPEEVDKIIPWNELYGITGIQRMNFNTLYQLCSDVKVRPFITKNAKALLFTPDLLAYFLTGKQCTEYTIASTGAILDASKRDFADDILAKLGIPKGLFCPLVQPGNILGELLPEIASETGAHGMKVINVASHDTASAVLAVPATDKNFLYISSGTWSLMGVECAEPVLNAASLKHCFTNEGGAGRTIRLLKNIMGLWLEQEARRQWIREGTKYTFDELSEMALKATPFASLINPDDDSFSPAGDMPARIREYCRKTGQRVPEGPGEIVRCIFESLALRYRWTAEKLEEILGEKYPVINILGGGTKEEMLSQFAADASGRVVSAGPVEATAIGNIIMQLIALGELKDISEAREVVRRSFSLKQYTPNTALKSGWDEAFAHFKTLVGDND